MYGLFMSKNVSGMHDGECMVMSIVHDKQRRGEKTKRKNCVKKWNMEEGKVKTNQDQRSKRARLLTRFRKGDPEGRRDHFHFDQKFSS